ncbi:MAG: hypothetical protein LBS69_04375 [Prevotellaceae bacterium]|nr:hypothetical protein [Prevotellaceae bacterium]
MENQLKKTGLQEQLFAQIRKNLPEHYSLVDLIAEILSVSTDAAYRRIRGAKILDIDEIVLLCSHFNLSFDRLFRIDTNQLQCSYSPLNLTDSRTYLGYMQKQCKNVSQLKSLPGCEIIFSATDVPFYHFLPFRELTFFKLYAWDQSTYHTQDSFTMFLDRMVSADLLECYSQTVDSYRQIPSIEIWTQNTVDYTLILIEYFYDMGHFASREIPLLLCEQFLGLINTIDGWTEQGIKNRETHTAFNLYLSNFFLESSLILLKHDFAMLCTLKLFTINSLNITDQAFCRETRQWLESLIRRSLLICGASERDRYLFFNGQRQKIRFLIDKICREK